MFKKIMTGTLAAVVAASSLAFAAFAADTTKEDVIKAAQDSGIVRSDYIAMLEGVLNSDATKNFDSADYEAVIASIDEVKTIVGDVKEGATDADLTQVYLGLKDKSQDIKKVVANLAEKTETAIDVRLTATTFENADVAFVVSGTTTDEEGNKVATPAVVITKDNAKGTILGDTNGDGKIDPADALEVLKSVVGLETNFEKNVADVDKNGLVDTQDALGILKNVVKLVGADFDLTGEQTK